MKIWFRVGMEAEISGGELDTLLIYDGQMNGERDAIKAHAVMENIIKRAELSGETYIPGKYNGCENYDNPDDDIDFLF